MTSNNYNGGGYTGNHQYSAYQSNNPAGSISRQYQQPAAPSYTAPPISTQSYVPYSNDTYSNQGVYSSHDNTLAGSSYGNNREPHNRAAEVLSNMSNMSYTNSTATDTAAVHAARYSNASPVPRQAAHAAPIPPQAAYGQVQARPRSTNAKRGLPSPATGVAYPSQQTTNVYNHQPQPKRTSSPATNHYQYPSHIPPAQSAQSKPADPVRQLPSIDSAGLSHASTVNVPERFDSNAVNTVDPMAVYDPWPEYRRQQEALRGQEALRAQKATEVAARAEEERRAEQKYKEEEQQLEERRKEEERQRKEQRRLSEQEEKAKREREAAAERAAQANAPSSAASSAEQDLEAEIRAMMAKMRELNGKDPALLAKIWEEERRAKAPKSPTVQSKTAPQPVTSEQSAPHPATTQASALQPSKANTGTPRTTNQRKPAKPKPKSTSSTPIQTSSIELPVSSTAPILASRSIKNTIWPPGKKAQLAQAASSYLNGINPTNNISEQQVLGLLEGNPSYIELCEQLEALGLKLDRAAFAKNLLTAVPDINSATRAQFQARANQGPSNGMLDESIAQRVQAPPPLMKPKTPAASGLAVPPHSTLSTHTAPSPVMNTPQTPFAVQNGSSSQAPCPVAEMIPIKPELKPPANKEEAARKRTFNDLIDLTLVDDEDVEPAPKRSNLGTVKTHGTNSTPAFDTSTYSSNIISPPPQVNANEPSAYPPQTLRNRVLAQPLDKRKALRRSSYNPATIARDVLLASGRHPDARCLNGHLDVLRLHAQISVDADLSTLRWDLMDPGNPPKGYYRDRAQDTVDDADDESNSDDEDAAQVKHEIVLHTVTTGGDQALPDPTNPFKVKRRGRPPKSAYSTPSHTPITARAIESNSRTNSPRPSPAGVGYSAFRSMETGPDGQPVPKKRGRPVGWRKAIHGVSAGQPSPLASQKPPTHQSSPRVRNPVMIKSRSPSVARSAPRYQSFKCRWRDCKAELHNLETLKKHMYKVHRKENAQGNVECLWNNCNTHFTTDARWREHLQKHYGQIAWELGDGPASGLSDAHESDAYLSDAQGRRVTPRVTATPSPSLSDMQKRSSPDQRGRGRGRPPKATSQEQEARDTFDRVVAHKIRTGGPGIDRGGATLVNEKRRRGFSEDDQEQEAFVDIEP